MNQAFDRESGHLSGQQLGNLGLIDSELSGRFHLFSSLAPNRVLKRLQ